MLGVRCALEPLDVGRHGPDLSHAFVVESDPRQWTYLPYGPFDAAGFATWLDDAAVRDDTVFHAIVDRAAGTALGLIAYLRIHPDRGSIEVGHVHFSPRLQRTATATEALYLMARRAFDELGYRRYEWKCNALNEGSRRAAERLGFTYEGTFRQHLVVKERNRDTSWFSMLDSEWPGIRAGYEAWLAPENFDASGRQKRRLTELIG